MSDEQVLQQVCAPDGLDWVARLNASQRPEVLRSLTRAVVDSELHGVAAPPQVEGAVVALGGSPHDLDLSVIEAAQQHTDPATGASLLGHAAVANVWSRLLRQEDALTNTEVVRWLHDDMIRGLAARCPRWNRFAAVALRQWVATTSPDPADGLTIHQLDRHPRESAHIVALALRDGDAGADLLERIRALRPETAARLAGSLVDEPSLPVGTRVRLATFGADDVREGARAMVARELGLTQSDLAALAPGGDEAPDESDDDSMPPRAKRLVWVWSAVAFVAGAILSPALRFTVLIAISLLVIAWLVGRRED